jgi:hypothetical protein
MRTHPLFLKGFFFRFFFASTYQYALENTFDKKKVLSIKNPEFWSSFSEHLWYVFIYRENIRKKPRTCSKAIFFEFSCVQKSKTSLETLDRPIESPEWRVIFSRFMNLRLKKSSIVRKWKELFNLSECCVSSSSLSLKQDGLTANLPINVDKVISSTSSWEDSLIKVVILYKGWKIQILQINWMQLKLTKYDSALRTFNRADLIFFREYVSRLVLDF